MVGCQISWAISGGRITPDVAVLMSVWLGIVLRYLLQLLLRPLERLRGAGVGLGAALVLARLRLPPVGVGPRLLPQGLVVGIRCGALGSCPLRLRALGVGSLWLCVGHRLPPFPRRCGASSARFGLLQI